MKVLLVAKYSIVEPLGLMFLSAVLHNEGHKVEIYLIKSGGTIILDKAKDFDYVGFSTYTGFHKTVFTLCDYIRAKKLSKVIIGGPHATFFSQNCLEHADYVVKGEGLESVLVTINGAKEGIIFTPTLVPSLELPFPRREELYKAYPSFKANPIKNVITSFGCPYKCSYCFNDSYKRLYKNFFLRQRSISSVIEECKELKRFKTKLIFFEDDCFGYSLKWLEEFANYYNNTVGLPFHCQIRPEMASDNRLKLLKLAGCHGITVAIETFNSHVRQNVLNRGASTKQIVDACEKIKSYGFHLRTEQMLGIPYTTYHDELKLLKLNVALKPDIAWTSIFAPYLGTELGDHCLKARWYLGNNDDLEDSFFSDSQITFSNKRKAKTNMLQKVFSTCARIPNGNKLAENFLSGDEHNFDKWFSTMRTHLYDNCLYAI